MTDKTDSKEREAPDDGQLVAIYKQANGEDVGKAQPLTTKRIINAMRAAFQAGRASLAANAVTDCARCGGSGEDPEGFYDQSRGDAGHTHDGPCRTCNGSGVAASAGSEPVARVNNDGFIVEIGDLLIAPGQKLYLHPSPPEGMVGGWIVLPGTLPDPGTPVLLDIGKKYPIRAMWAAKFTLPVSLEDDSGFGEHDERTDEWYCPEGWYEWNEHEETHWAVSETPRAWAPLPPTSSADSSKEQP